MQATITPLPTQEECELWQTAVSDGSRFIPVRLCEFTERQYLDTQIVAHGPGEAMRLIRLSEMDLGHEWAEENPLLGLAKVQIQVVEYLNVCDLGPQSLPRTEQPK